MNTILRDNNTELKSVLKLIPMGKIGSVDDGANVVEFLAPNKAGCVIPSNLDQKLTLKS